MSLKLIATDMDGTLLRDTDKAFDTERFNRIMDAMEEQGIHFVVASGNQLPKLHHYLEGYRARPLTYIAENGAYIADQEKDILISGFSDKTIQQTLAVLDEFPAIGVIISGHQHAYMPTHRAEPIARLIRDHMDFLGADYDKQVDPLTFISRWYPTVRPIDDYADLRDETVVKFALQTRRRETDQILAELINRLPSNVVPVTSGFGAIDLISRGVNKGSALKWLGEQQNIKPEEMIAFGDAANDAEMLSYVGTGIAMDNASPALKASADLVIGNNNDGGVLDYLEEILGISAKHLS
ncbi:MULTISPECIES: HAD family hydrolase [unclassified Rothia (in: high G+C Gram-positive bacteria)]|uniref:HAD family hydrolase n=1 Tax=unclassified Rothia (in: high G+C Gram-positive bacteria) TaxID=2689056 RepID=UPI00195B79C9|nr:MULTISPECIES: HAD family hydrolase [unclassified Rothia (in: high G+C Gram-positive bacteria)]MBM7051450.1 HAD family phosphatase [Rothia sp. ZJ1223]QRZ61240.1 HAD family phosphatase [Rothia sp. ZJ932]